MRVECVGLSEVELSVAGDNHRFANDVFGFNYAAVEHAFLDGDGIDGGFLVDYDGSGVEGRSCRGSGAVEGVIDFSTFGSAGNGYFSAFLYSACGRSEHRSCNLFHAGGAIYTNRSNLGNAAVYTYKAFNVEFAAFDYFNYIVILRVVEGVIECHGAGFVGEVVGVGASALAMLTFFTTMYLLTISVPISSTVISSGCTAVPAVPALKVAFSRLDICSRPSEKFWYLPVMPVGDNVAVGVLGVEITINQQVAGGVGHVQVAAILIYGGYGRGDFSEVVSIGSFKELSDVGSLFGFNHRRLYC